MVVFCEKCGKSFIQNSPFQRWCGSYRKKTGCAYQRRLEKERIRNTTEYTKEQKRKRRTKNITKYRKQEVKRSAKYRKTHL